MGLFFCQLVLKLGIDEETFNEFLYFLELFTTVFCVSNYFFCVSNYFTIVFCVGNYNVQTERELHYGN